MSDILAGIWNQIEPSRPSGDELVARPVAPAKADRLLAAVDSRGHRHLLVALSEKDAAYFDGGSRGLSVTTQALLVPGRAQTRYINIACEDIGGNPMLDLIGGELADHLQGPVDAPSEVVARVLGKWRRFWGQLPRQILGREAQIGLFAEIWFLTYWMIPAVGIPDAVRRWRGPLGALHDFEHRGLSVEVKGTTSTRGRIFKIHGVRQLEPPEDGRLLFFGVRLREEAGASNNLPMLVDECRRRVSVDPDAEGLFDTGLIAAGYLPVHNEEYAKAHWRVIEEILCDVRAEFPRIVAAIFSAGLPSGVEEIDYSINLGACEKLIVARRPGDAIDVLTPRA